MKFELNSLPTLTVLLPIIVVATLLLLFGFLFLEELIYPLFMKVAYMNVPEKEYHVAVEEESGLLGLKPAPFLTEKEREEAVAQVEDEYRRLYGGEYGGRLRKDVKAARKQVGDEAYEKLWGPILRDYEK
ncbi:MAG: hypothetical protein P9M00_11320 [Candidatus Tritonobacter lacicola]|nr:hypothetical protein [Candidatus Tritonobacter lacicola]